VVNFLAQNARILLLTPLRPAETVMKIRKQIYIEPYQEALLKRLTDETGESEAEIIRQAIDQHARLIKSMTPRPSAWEEEQKFIANLMKREPVRGGRTWRRKDLYDR
jgi:hypothetical protein